MDWNKHKERLFYGGLALAFALGFIALGYVDLPQDGSGGEWIGAAKTILTGLAMLCYNKTRGNTDKNTDTNQ